MVDHFDLIFLRVICPCNRFGMIKSEFITQKICNFYNVGRFYCDFDAKGFDENYQNHLPEITDISFAIPFSNAGGSDSFVRVVVDDPEELTILTVGVLEEDKDFDTITGCCLELGGTSIDVSVPLLGSTLMML